MGGRAERIVFAFLADTHFNHSLGLLSPKTRLPGDPGGVWTPGMTPVQEWLWECFTEDVRGLAKFARKDRLFVFLAGDVCQGNKHKDEMVSMRESDQVLMAVQGLAPIMAIPQLEKFFIVKGTDAHDMLAGSLATLVGEQMRLTYPQIDVGVAFHPIVKADGGLIVNVSHHGPGYGKRAWLNGNELGWYVKDVMMKEIMEGGTPPNILVRADVHNYAMNISSVVTRGKTYLTLGLILPPYTVANSFARKVARSPEFVGVGMIAVEAWTDGRVNYKPWESLHYLDLRKEVRV